MNSRTTISDELKGLDSQLSAGLNRLPFSIPQDYFEGFADNLMSRIKASDAPADEEIQSLSPLLAGLSRKMPFEVPSQYFEGNTGNLPAVTEDEVESLVLSFISKEMPYQVPLGYFANFPDQMIEKLGNRRAKVNPLMRTKWMRVAAAAVIAGIITLSGLLYFNNGGTQAAGTEPIAKEIEKVSTEELDAFISSTAGLSSSPDNRKSVSAEAKALLNDVSDKELEAFLSSIPTEELPFADEELNLLYN